MSIHSVTRSHTHLAWDNSIPPVLQVQSGETITFDCLDASNGQITKDSTAATISSLVFSQLDQVSGPVFVHGAVPGDTLQVEVLSVDTADWGWTGLIPGFGLLHDEFPEPALKIWSLDTAGGFAWFNEEKGMKILLKPFAGEMGVAPGKKGAFSTIPPYNTGGNIDTKHVAAGSTLYLPVEVEGALFSIGARRIRQVSFIYTSFTGTAIETPMKVTVRLTARKDRPYTKTPHFHTRRLITTLDDEYYCTTGVDPDIKEATRSAVRHMIEFLCAEHQLDRVEAYMLCSVGGDLRMHEVVDMPNYVVRFYHLPLSVP
ncbi:hypothetical protein BDQ12DRAFT_605967 [Crucibulum laeve]|uniref:Acetamidase/Formamidase n=1 Tax=Crucibulum laeve TaxID=68775 RepID=A0A5C3M0C0_9AGAR|nr:hypothetical protein BDQ12DRAFT_605967 [Crucibulum laeve]